jgi:hypothetical protein
MEKNLDETKVELVKKSVQREKRDVVMRAGSRRFVL